jgi:hypothetical protein
MPHSKNIDELDAAKVIDANQVTSDAQKVIDKLTPQELQAIKSAYAKVDPKNQPQVSNVMQMAGF